MTEALLSRLTLIVLSYGRPDYVLRNMRYWSGRAVAVHVLDGSPSAILAENMSGLSDNVCYHFFPGASYIERLKQAFELVKTEYVSLLPDDEFFLPGALVSCIKELDAHQDLVSCGGRCISFKPSEGKIVSTVPYPRLENYSISQNSPIDRMFAHAMVYVPSTIYSVMRTPVWKRALLAFIKKEFPVYGLAELQFELSVCYQGKSKIISELMWLRSLENQPIRGTDPCLTVANRFDLWWQDPNKKIERDEFLTITSAVLEESESKILQAKVNIKKALDIYVRESALLKKSTLTITIQKLKSMVKFFLPAVILKKIRKNEKLILQLAQELADSGVKVNFEELSNVELIISKFHTGLVRL